MRDIKERLSPPLKDFNRFLEITNEGTLHLKAKKEYLAVSLEAIGVSGLREEDQLLLSSPIYKTLG